MTTLLEILTQVKNGQSSIAEALEKLQAQPLESIEDACIDHQRPLRTGIPEVVYGASKTADQIIGIGASLFKKNEIVLITRVDPEKALCVQQKLPQLIFHKKARILCGNPKPINKTDCRGTILVVCAGTSDIPVAEEARITAKSLGHPVEKLYDVGVAGLHRLLNRLSLLSSASAIIVVAGMEGALPSVVGGLVSAPIIGVPTSVGYGANFGGIAALLGMLNSCSPGLAVVNIDNGFGAACMAVAINRM